MGRYSHIRNVVCSPAKNNLKNNRETPPFPDGLGWGDAAAAARLVFSYISTVPLLSLVPAAPKSAR